MRGETVNPEEENRGEAEVRGWEQEEAERSGQGGQGGERRRSWFGRLIGGKKGKIRLEEDHHQHDGDAGDGD
jgi:hypothetical protein